MRLLVIYAKYAYDLQNNKKLVKKSFSVIS